MTNVTIRELRKRSTLPARALTATANPGDFREVDGLEVVAVVTALAGS